jgi:hypothetical protein
VARPWAARLPGAACCGDVACCSVMELICTWCYVLAEHVFVRDEP